MTTKEIDEIIDEVIANNTAIEAFREFGASLVFLHGILFSLWKFSMIIILCA